jgi:CRISPR-associated endoribonuclease Cas6
MIDDCKIFNLKIRRLGFSTATPIIIRIPRYIYEIVPKYSYNYIFWKNDYPLEIFINQLKTNLEKKYFNYYNVKPSINLFESLTLVFKKQVSHKISINGCVQTLIGTLWDFWLDDFDISNNINECNKDRKDTATDILKLFRFTLEAGLGERNSLGYGFINPL